MTLPKIVFIKVEEGSDEEWLNTQKELKGLVATGEKVEVGVYHLVEKVLLEGKIVEVGKSVVRKK